MYDSHLFAASNEQSEAEQSSDCSSPSHPSLVPRLRNGSDFVQPLPHTTAAQQGVLAFLHSMQHHSPHTLQEALLVCRSQKPE